MFPCFQPFTAMVSTRRNKRQNIDMANPDRLVFHLSESAGITRFDPRPDETGRAVVWAIDALHAPNYWLPRDCPRVCVRAGGCLDPAQRELILGDASHVVYVESEWRDRIEKCELYSYAFDAREFTCVDENAGYFQTSHSVFPIECAPLGPLDSRLRDRQVSLRFIESLWPIQRMVSESMFEFSCIRMRNARPQA